ncbi:NhaA-like Na+/H+ antiporter [Candidatus Megaera venefica]|jgi:Na+:H+ antiporter, NhaA family|uniref:Na(+)/H(+) antiporter NhaA n=1 Tax=Candidatus Megaera venefica TaxID=2055910 RepID=A0ABU5NDP5_9RICK|nr:Na+/H+ antiporter NhaA [Candidatus Megaera venefica]MEA0971273.1 NhaA-like Na+/H+ antiporter [Candidatus Megaera venefica]
MTLSHKQIDTVGGVLMIAAMWSALILSNTTDWYYEFISSPIKLSSVFFHLEQSLESIVKDILMVIFFSYIGMELRYEFHEGSLSDKRQVLLPLVAAIGGMVVPAVFYLLINISYPENYPGFAVPCATDIAFAICLFNLIGGALPTSIKVFLLSIAIFDDLGAIIIIAIFYSSDFNLLWVWISLPLLACFWIFNRKKITTTYLYILVGTLLCIGFHNAGLHTTLAGFLTGFFIPLTKKTATPYLKELMYKLHPWVQFIILPLFAFTSSGVDFSNDRDIDFFNPIFLGVACGLFLGKQLGVTLFSYITIKLRWASLPPNSKFTHVYIISVFCGIGFTMSLFVGLLAFPDSATQSLAKIGVIVGSLSSVVLAILLNTIRKIRIF